MDRSYINRQIVKGLTKPDDKDSATGTVRQVNRIAKQAYVSMLGSTSGVWMPIATQELAEALEGRVNAGARPSVRIENGIIVDQTSRSGSAGGSGAGIISPNPGGGTKPGGSLFAPQWREVNPLVAGVRSITAAWLPIFGGNVIGYRVKVADAQGITNFYTFNPDEIEVTINGIVPGVATVQVQGIAAGGVAGDFNAPLQATVLADITPPDQPTALVHSWASADRTLDLFFSWIAPAIPDDFAGYDIELRNANGGVRRSLRIDGNTTQVAYRFDDNRTDQGGASPKVLIAVRSRDVYGNASAWLETMAVFPELNTPATMPRLSTIFKQVNVDVDPAPKFAARTEIFVSPGDKTLQLAKDTTHATFFGATGTTYTVSYRYIDSFERATGYSPAATITVARNEIGFDDLGALEQVTVKSSYASRTSAELSALIDNKLLDQAFTTVANETITFEYPIATRIAGIMLYTPSATTPNWYLSYDRLEGGVLELGGNTASTDVVGTQNNMIMREFAPSTNGNVIAEATTQVGGYFMREYRFGDANANPGQRKFKAIATRRIRIIFTNAVAISEVRILTYEAANTFVGRRMYLSEGLQIQSDSSNTGFQITAQAIAGYNNGVEQVSISSVDGKLRAAAGRITLDATGISIVPDTDFQTQRTYSFRASDGTMIGELGNRYIGPNSGFGTYGTNQTRLKGYPKSQTNTVVELVAEAIEGRAANVFLDTYNGASSAYVDVLAVGSTAKVTVGPDLQVDRHVSIYGDLYKRGNNGAVYGAGVVVPLFATSSSWNNRDAGVGWHTHSITEWGVPSNAKGVFIRVGGRGDAQSDNNFIAISHNMANYPLVCRQSVPTTSYVDQHGFCPVADGNIYIRVNGVTFRSIYVIVTGFVL